METIKKHDQYTIYKKRSGRYGIQDVNRQWVRGEEKIKILLAEKLIKLTPKKKTEAAPEAPTVETPEAKAKSEEKAS